MADSFLARIATGVGRLFATRKTEQADTKPQPLDAAALRGQEIAFVDSYLYGGYSPTPYNPDDLVAKKGIQVYREMLRDDQVKACIFAKQDAVLASGWEIKDVKIAEDDAEGEDSAEETGDYLRFVLEEIDGTVETKIVQMMSGMSYGYSVNEPVFKLIKYGPFEGKIGLRDIKTRKPDGFDFDTDIYGNLLPDGVIQGTRRLPANRFVIYSHREHFSNIYGESDLRAAYAPFWIKENISRFMTMMFERHGMPIPVFQSEGVLTAQQNAALQNFINNLQAKTGMIIPKGVTVKFEEPGRGAGESFVMCLNYLDRRIGTALMVPQLMGLSAEGQTGSLARSATEFDVFLWIVQRLRADFAALLNEKLFKPLTDLNYEVTDGKYPQFVFKAITEARKRELADMFNAAKNAGTVTVRPKDENRMRELIELEPLSDEEMAQQEAEKEAQKQAMADAITAKNGGEAPEKPMQSSSKENEDDADGE